MVLAVMVGRRRQNGIGRQEESVEVTNCMKGRTVSLVASFRGADGIISRASGGDGTRKSHACFLVLISLILFTSIVFLPVAPSPTMSIFLFITFIVDIILNHTRSSTSATTTTGSFRIINPFTISIMTRHPYCRHLGTKIIKHPRLDATPHPCRSWVNNPPRGTGNLPQTARGQDVGGLSR